MNDVFYLFIILFARTFDWLIHSFIEVLPELHEQQPAPDQLEA